MTVSQENEIFACGNLVTRFQRSSRPLKLGDRTNTVRSPTSIVTTVEKSAT